MTVSVIDVYKHLLNEYCKDLNIVSTYGVLFNNTQALRQNTFDNNAHQFAFEYLGVPITGLRNQREMALLIEAMKGGVNKFYWQPPDLFFKSLGNPTSDPLLVAGSDANSNVVQIGANNTNGDFLMPGDMVNFSNHPKAYRILAIDQTVNPVVTLNTGLVKSVTTSDSMITRNVQVYVKLDTENGDSFDYAREAGDFDSEFELRLIEA